MRKLGLFALLGLLFALSKPTVSNADEQKWITIKGQIVLADVSVSVFSKMMDGSHRPSVIKRARGIRQEEQKMAPGANNPAPLGKCGEGIGDMFEAMRGEDEVVGVVAQAMERGRLAEELNSGRLGRVKDKRSALAQPGFPCGVGSEVDVVDGGRGVVDG